MLLQLLKLLADRARGNDRGDDALADIASLETYEQGQVTGARHDAARRLLPVQPIAEPVADLVGRHLVVAALLPHVVDRFLAVHEESLDQRRWPAIFGCSAAPTRALWVDCFEPLPQCSLGTLQMRTQPVRTGAGQVGERLRALRAGAHETGSRYLFIGCLQWRASWDARIVLLVCRRCLKSARTAGIAAALDRAWSQAETIITFGVNLHGQDRRRSA